MSNEDVARDVRRLASGTVAGLIRELGLPEVDPAQYAVIDRVQAAFAEHVAAVEKRLETWQDGWADFRSTSKAAEAATGRPAIAVYHVRYDADRDVSDRLRFPLIDRNVPFDAPGRGQMESVARAAAAAELFAAGHYKKVASVVDVDGEHGLERAWALTQNGGASDSWSQDPPPSVLPEPPGHIVAADGRRLGYRSTDIGDIAELADGRRYVVDTFGFAEMPAAPKPAVDLPTGKTFSELFVGARPDLRTLAEGWHREVGQTSVGYLRLFASLTPAEEVSVIKARRAVKPRDGEAMDALAMRRCTAVTRALDAIQAARGLPPVELAPPSKQAAGQPYRLTEGDKLECQRIARATVRFFGSTTMSATVRIQGDGLPDRHLPDGGGWYWVKVCDAEGTPLRMGKAGVTVGDIQCGTRQEAEAFSFALRRAIDIEAARAEKKSYLPLKVRLSSCGNVDHDENPERPAPGRPAQTWVPVATLEDASRVCREYIEKHDLGSGQWTGGTIFDQDSATVGRVSYNGRVWAPPGPHEGDRILYDPFAPAPRVEKPDGPAPAADDRLFAGVYPAGIAWADRSKTVGGDYKRVAFLPFDTLKLDIERDCPPDLRERIVADAAAVQARRGEEFQVSTSGQTVRLGSRLDAAPSGLDVGAALQQAAKAEDAARKTSAAPQPELPLDKPSTPRR